MGALLNSANMAAYIVFLLVCVMASSFIFSDAASVVDVYRLIQYDLRGQPFGSRRAGLSQHASSGLDVPGADLARAVVLMSVSDLNHTLLNEVLQGKRFIGGLLLLLPASYQRREAGGGDGDGEEDGDGDGKSGVDFDALASLEQILLFSNIPVPVYFVVEDKKLKAMFEEVKANDAAGRPATAQSGGYKLMLPSPEPRKKPATPLVNIQGWLQGLRGEGDGAVLPTIAIVASYDTFGAAPALATGSDSNGSGVVALLELLRLFSRLYASPKTRGRKNLVFALTAGGPFDFQGTKQWLAGFDQRELEMMEFAFCLHSLGGGSGGPLHMHVAKPKRDETVGRLFQHVQGAASELGVDVELTHKKVNLSVPRVPWEHEQFSWHSIVAATISRLSSAPEPFAATGGIADKRKQVNDTAVIESIKIVAEALGREIYGIKGRAVQLFADGSSLGVSRPFVRHWLDLLSRTPRVIPFLSKDAPIISALQKEVADHATSMTLKPGTLDSSFVFYESPPVTQLRIHQVASVTFDLVILLAISTYLGILYLLLHISTKGLDDLMGILKRPQPRGKGKVT